MRNGTQPASDIDQARCLSWINRVTSTARRELPFFPNQRTSPIRCVRSEKCQLRQFCADKSWHKKKPPDGCFQFKPDNSFPRSALALLLQGSRGYFFPPSCFGVVWSGAGAVALFCFSGGACFAVGVCLGAAAGGGSGATGALWADHHRDAEQSNQATSLD